MKPRKIGIFEVAAGPGEYDRLRASQWGCAVLRCEYLAHTNSFETVAEFHEFDAIDLGRMTPRYDVELTEDLNGNVVRKCFRRQD